MISLAQVLGFIIGPAIQAAVVPLGHNGFWLIPNKLQLNMYTATGWVNVVLTCFNIYLFFPHLFKEHKIATKEVMIKKGLENEKETWKLYKPDYFATWTLIVSFFVIVFNFMILETLGTPLSMDQFGWSKAASLKNMGIVMSGGAVLSIVTFASIGPLCRRFSEEKVMIWGGFLFMVVGRACFIPFKSDPPHVYDVNFKLNMSLLCDDNQGSLNETIRNASLNCGEDILGCPSSQEWCKSTPALTFTQFLTGYILTAFGYPVGVTLIQTIFSKILGPRPQVTFFFDFPTNITKFICSRVLGWA